VQEAQAAAQEAGVAQGEFSDDMDVDVIVHDQHAPRRRAGGRVGGTGGLRLAGGRRLVVYHPISIVIVLIHAGSRR